MDLTPNGGAPRTDMCTGSQFETNFRTFRAIDSGLRLGLIANRARTIRYGCPVGTLCTEFAKPNRTSQVATNMLYTLFRTWLRKQFTLLGRKTDGDELALHRLARSQGVAPLAIAFQDEIFIEQEVQLMCDRLSSRPVISLQGIAI